MKKSVLFFMVMLAIQIAGHSQDDKYTAAMQKSLAGFDSAKSAEDLTKLANTFERIGDAEKTQWLPYYYAGLALSNAGWMPSVSDKDANATKINAFCDKAESIATDNADKSEIEVLRNMSATQQMMIDPQNRYMTYGQAAGKALEKGMQLNENNPRLYYLRGMSLFNTPSQFGGGKDKAKTQFEKAITLYKAQSPKPLYPRWGQPQSEQMLAQCQ
ncbi:MAG TPA: hypothetical protein VK644_13405 [Chitinophagaceae bacterium]|nr:hypothetical protein [Chitinophagaceae bacterium]